jgi:hypothetical protein
MKRQPAGEARKRYPLQLSDEERARYQSCADADNRDLADWIRVTLDEAVVKARKGKARR